MPFRLAAATALAAAALSIAAPLTATAGTSAIIAPSSKLIVVGRSVAGLKLGAEYGAMVKAWGAPKRCAADRSTCLYYARAGSAHAVVRFTKGAVTTLELAADPKSHQAGTLSGIRDEIGVRVGLKSRDLAAAYPAGSWHSSSVFVIPGPAHGETVFESTKGKITTLMVRVAPDYLASIG
ncbi:MAG: hypothetical protein AAGC46_12155 [Solirubrobacteraceae bacterium]|nr:hypothetical protein [Patulibacter sp.]